MDDGRRADPCLSRPGRDKFLETAINGEASCIVTGDADLLALDPFDGLRILTPRAFLEP
jgi:uncharacterized protein